MSTGAGGPVCSDRLHTVARWGLERGGGVFGPVAHVASRVTVRGIFAQNAHSLCQPWGKASRNCCSLDLSSIWSSSVLYLIATLRAPYTMACAATACSGRRRNASCSSSVSVFTTSVRKRADNVQGMDYEQTFSTTRMVLGDCTTRLKLSRHTSEK